MPRPDLTEERTAMILDAFARCVARKGLDATSLENVADEAGVKRSILRHYVGNRDDLINALAARADTRYRQLMADMKASLPKQRPANALLDFLFWDYGDETNHDVQVVEVLMAAARNNDSLRTISKGWVDDFTQIVADTLQRHYPKASKNQCWTVAYGVVSIYYSHESLRQMPLPDKYRRAARASAEMLTDTLAS